MATEAFTIAKRPGWGASVTVNIECDPLASMGVKIGLAVRVGHATRAYLAGAYLAGADLARANLARADLTRAYLAGAYLAGADLTGADLTGANLAGADLTGANLAGADLTGAYLAGADLAGADLTGANLYGADLTGANLTGAYLAGADLYGAIIRGDKIARLVAVAQRLTLGNQYTFYAFELEVGGVKVHAGCRWFTIPEFRAHVASQYPDTDKAEETLAILDFIERRAVAVGAVKEAAQ
jgi:hypothetical protein